MEIATVTVKALVDGLVAPEAQVVELDGYLVCPATDRRVWMAVDDQTADPVVMLQPAEALLDVLLDEVAAWIGGRFIYINQASITGTLTSSQQGYVLSDISTINVWEGPILVQLILSSNNNELCVDSALRKVPVSYIADEDPGPEPGPIELDGFLAYSASNHKAWLAVDEDRVEPVVALEAPQKILTILQEGNFPTSDRDDLLYGFPAKVAGAELTEQETYLLTSVSRIRIDSAPHLNQ